MSSLLEFAELYKRKEGSKRLAKISIKLYLETICNINEYPSGCNTLDAKCKHLDQISSDYITSGRDYEADLTRFVMSLDNYAPKTQRNRFSFVHQWFLDSDITIRPGRLKKLKMMFPKNRAISQEDEITVSTIQAIYNQMASLQGRALILVLMSSGMRLGEALNIREQDINWDVKPVEIIIPYEIILPSGKKWTPKNDESRYTFISHEAAALLKDWFKIKNQWLITASSRGGKAKNKRSVDNRVFPLSQATVSLMLKNALIKAGLANQDPITKHFGISPHSFRAYFISQLKLAMNHEIVEMLAGHQGYLSDAYRRYPKDQVREAYLKAEYAVSLNGPDITLKMDLESQKSAM